MSLLSGPENETTSDGSCYYLSQIESDKNELYIGDGSSPERKKNIKIILRLLVGKRKHWLGAAQLVKSEEHELDKNVPAHKFKELSKYKEKVEKFPQSNIEIISDIGAALQLFIANPNYGNLIKLMEILAEAKECEDNIISVCRIKICDKDYEAIRQAGKVLDEIYRAGYYPSGFFIGFKTRPCLEMNLGRIVNLFYDRGYDWESILEITEKESSMRKKSVPEWCTGIPFNECQGLLRQFPLSNIPIINDLRRALTKFLDYKNYDCLINLSKIMADKARWEEISDPMFNVQLTINVDDHATLLEVRTLLILIYHRGFYIGFEKRPCLETKLGKIVDLFYHRWHDWESILEITEKESSIAKKSVPEWCTGIPFNEYKDRLQHFPLSNIPIIKDLRRALTKVIRYQNYKRLIGLLEVMADKARWEEVSDPMFNVQLTINVDDHEILLEVRALLNLIYHRGFSVVSGMQPCLEPKLGIIVDLFYQRWHDWKSILEITKKESSIAKKSVPEWCTGIPFDEYKDRLQHFPLSNIPIIKDLGRALTNFLDYQNYGRLIGLLKVMADKARWEEVSNHLSKVQLTIKADDYFKLVTAGSLLNLIYASGRFPNKLKRRSI